MKRFGKAFCPKCKVIYFVDRSSCCNKRILTIYKFIVLTFSQVQEVKDMSGVFFVNPFHCLEVQDQFEESNGLLSICLCLREAVEELTRTFYAASLVQSA